MFNDSMLEEKLSFEANQTAQELQLLKEDAQKVHATLSKHAEPIRAKQPKLFEMWGNLWEEAFGQNQSAKKYF